MVEPQAPFQLRRSTGAIRACLVAVLVLVTCLGMPVPAVAEEEPLPPPPESESDACRNIDGVQVQVPGGMFIDAVGDCAEPPNMAAGDGIDEVTETEEPVACADPSCSVIEPSGVTADPGAGSGPSTPASEDDAAAPAGGGPTAVAGVSAAPAAVPAQAMTAPSGALPFTGARLELLVAVGLLLVASGAGMWRGASWRARRT